MLSIIEKLPAPGISASEGAKSWQSPACPFAIETPPTLLLQIRRRAVEGFHALPFGGLETGGILFGRVHPNARAPRRLELVAERPIVLSHERGPAFLLTDEEKESVRTTLERSRFDPELAALSFLGFWVSHSRSSLKLTPEDLELYSQLFPHPWQIVLIVKPESGAPTKAAFHFRKGRALEALDADAAFVMEAAAAPENTAGLKTVESNAIEGSAAPRGFNRVPVLIGSIAFAFFAGAIAGFFACRFWFRF